MIKEYKKIIIMAVILLILIVGIVVVLAGDMDFGVFKTLSLKNISAKKDQVELIMLEESVEKINLEKKLDELEKAKNNYEASKEKYDKIDDATIELVQEATIDEKYFIEYLWIVLGNYARENNLMIDIITPGSSSESITVTAPDGTTTSQDLIDTNIKNGTIRVTIKGRYANVADFVYEVENDKELKFKLDNIKMTYTSDNAIQATFSVLSLQVKK